MLWRRKSAALTVSHDQLAALADLMSGRIASTQPASVSFGLPYVDIERLAEGVATRIAAKVKVVALSDGEIDRLATRLADRPVTLTTGNVAVIAQAVADLVIANQPPAPTQPAKPAKPARHGSEWSLAEQEQLRSMRAGKMKWAEIAARLERSEGTVVAMACKMGITRGRAVKSESAPVTPAKVVKAKWSRKDRGLLRRLRAEKVPFAEIAVQTGRTVTAVKKKAYAMGIAKKRKAASNGIAAH